MPFCPECRSEFREGFETCAPCGVSLVIELAPEIAVGGTVEEIEAAVEAGTAVVIAQGNHQAVGQMRILLADRRVPAMVIGDPDSCVDGGVCTVFQVVVAPGGVEPARAALAEHYQDMIVAQGLDLAAAGAAVELESGEDIRCPACNEEFRPTSVADAECPDCGLFLGVPEGLGSQE